MEQTKEPTSVQDSNDEKNQKGLKKAWSKLKKGLHDLWSCVHRFLFIDWMYNIEAEQAYRKLKSEFTVLSSIVQDRSQKTAEDHDALEEIKTLIAEADSLKHYTDLWPFINNIKLQMTHLLDTNDLISRLHIAQNNLYLLDASDKKQWEDVLAQFKQDSTPSTNITPSINTAYLRSTLYALTTKLQEARRLNYLTIDMKRALIKRILVITILIGAVSTLFAFYLVHDPLVIYAVAFGILGGFVSKMLSLDKLEFKPSAFSLVALYTYIQPLFGGLGALILYIILISPIGPQVFFNSETFYLSKAETKQYVISKLMTSEVDSVMFKRMDSLRVDSTQTLRKSIPYKQRYALISDTSQIYNFIPQYPKPSLFLLLAFLAGFSERWLLGTLETIVGKKLQQQAQAEKGTPNEQK
ncbi:MAG: hypothetical protein NTX44_00620 [Ignavibacteriales bacterium]|nr:hypothetical protein [Ignavibacteriales bacterium]